MRNRLLILILLGMPLSSSAIATPVVDQFYTDTTSLGALIGAGDAYVGQTFVVGKNGTLVGADLYFGRHSSYTGLWTVEIRDANEYGIPGSAVLASATLSSDTVRLVGQGVIGPHVNFQNGPVVEEGQALALLLRTEPPVYGGSWRGIWSGSSNSGYVHGTLVGSSDGVEFLTYNGDVFFATYVEVPEPCTTALILAVAASRGLRRRCRPSFTSSQAALAR